MKPQRNRTIKLEKKKESWAMKVKEREEGKGQGVERKVAKLKNKKRS